jgi:hypothetical protein
LSEAARIFQALDVPLHLSVSSSKVGLWWLTGGQRGPRYELQPSRSLDRILAIIPAHDYLARASAQLVLTQMGKVVTNDDLRNHVWGVRAGTTDPIHKTVDAALTVIEPALHEAHVWIQRQRYQFRSVPTPDLPIEDDVFIDGKTLLLQGPLGGDDSPLSIEQYLMAQTLISAAGSYVWRDRLYAEASGLRCPRTEGYEKSVRDLDRRLALVGATKRLQFEFQEVALRPPFDHAPFDHAAFDRLTSGVSTSFTGRSRYADIWPDFVLHGNIGISGGDRIAPAYQEVLARILRMPVAFQDQFVLLRGMDGGGLSLQRLSDELTKLAFRLELDSCRLADGQVGYRLVFNGRKPMERYLWSPKLRRNCKARRSDMDAITRSHLVEFEEAYSRGSDAIDEDAERSYGYLLGQLRPTVPAAEDAKPSFARSLLETIRSRPLYVASDNNDRVVRERFAKWLTIYGRERHAANVTAQAFLDEAMRRKVLPAPLWRACAAEVDLRQWQLFTEIGIELLRKGRFFSQSQISRFGASDDIRQRYMVGKQFCKAAYEAFPDVCEPIEEPTFALLHDAVMELSSRGEWEAAWSLSDSRVGLPGNA